MKSDFGSDQITEYTQTPSALISSVEFHSQFEAMKDTLNGELMTDYEAAEQLLNLYHQSNSLKEMDSSSLTNLQTEILLKSNKKSAQIDCEGNGRQ